MDFNPLWRKKLIFFPFLVGKEQQWSFLVGSSIAGQRVYTFFFHGRYDVFLRTQNAGSSGSGYRMERLHTKSMSSTVVQRFNAQKPAYFGVGRHAFLDGVLVVNGVGDSISREVFDLQSGMIVIKTLLAVQTELSEWSCENLWDSH